MRIKRNSAKCLLCGDEIESVDVHDYVACSCGNIAVDGGHEYLRRAFDPSNGIDSYIDTSEWEDEKTGEVIRPRDLMRGGRPEGTVNAE